jgi:hypothetical protein
MLNVFICYHHQARSFAGALAKDIESLGHIVWFDQALSGGQLWWDRILAEIRNCGVFVFVLTQKALDSPACEREYGYADELGKPVLPIQINEEALTNLPPALSRIQHVDYKEQNFDAFRLLARAFTTIPSPHRLPDPLPPPPEVPILGEQPKSKKTVTTQPSKRLYVGEIRLYAPYVVAR